jgi:hypothetical protein
MPVDIHILNFNYTSTPEQYLKKLVTSNSNLRYSINYIHGKTGEPNNPLIFGFGDELDENYLEMEKEETEGFLEYVKSFWYFRTNNYHDLLRFINSGSFEVLILGHSCGLSDRTMLSMVFEHTNCISIKIFYHKHQDGSNNFKTLTQDISRHFRNKIMLREKIVPLTKSNPLPQWD